MSSISKVRNAVLPSATERSVSGLTGRVEHHLPETAGGAGIQNDSPSAANPLPGVPAPPLEKLRQPPGSSAETNQAPGSGAFTEAADKAAQQFSLYRRGQVAADVATPGSHVAPLPKPMEAKCYDPGRAISKCESDYVIGMSILGFTLGTLAKNSFAGMSIGGLIGQVTAEGYCDDDEQISRYIGHGGAPPCGPGSQAQADPPASSDPPADSIMFQNDSPNPTPTSQGVCEVGQIQIDPQTTPGPNNTTTIIHPDGTYETLDSNGQVIETGTIQDGPGDSGDGGGVIEDGGDGGDVVEGSGDGVDGGDGVEGPGDGGDGGTGCFVAGTPVLLGDGTFVPIERVRVDDVVLSRSEKSGITTPRRVLRHWSHRDHPTLVFQLKGGARIETTKEHRFAVPGRGFVAAGQLAIGDRLETNDGQGAEISALESQLGRFTVYNLTVETDHTYFVGKAGVWVHNDKDSLADENDGGGKDVHGKSADTP